MAKNLVSRSLSDKVVQEDGSDTPTFLNKELNPLVRQMRAAINDPAGVIVHTGGTATLTLPSAEGLGDSILGRQLLVINHGTGVLTLAAEAGETVNGAATIAVVAGSLALLVADGGTQWRSNVPRGTRDTARGEAQGFAGSYKFTASADSSSNTAPYSFAYTIDYTGKNLPSNITGVNIFPTETNLGTGSPIHIVLFVGTTAAGEIFSVRGGASPVIRMRKTLDQTGDSTLGGNAVIGGGGKTVGFYGSAGTTKAAAPTTLADVIAILQGVGLCS